MAKTQPKVVKGEDEKARLLRAYVRELLTTLNTNPTPGACRKVEYIAPRETWMVRADAAEAHFLRNGVAFSVGVRDIKLAWMSISALVDKAMKTHSKCDCCAWYGSRLFGLQGKVDLISCGERASIRREEALHRILCANERGELDDAGYRSMMYPTQQWTFLADGATQRNFILPRLRRRMPKELARKEMFATKLYGVYLYGYGMHCYVVHESVGGGANLACTCIYLTFLDAIASGRRGGGGRERRRRRWGGGWLHG